MSSTFDLTVAADDDILVKISEKWKVEIYGFRRSIGESGTRMKNRLLFAVALIVAKAIGEGLSASPAMSTIATLGIIGVSDAASWGEVQAQKYVTVSPPSDSSQ